MRLNSQYNKPKYFSTNFDDLRYWIYHHAQTCFTDMPPTTASIRLHILRAFFITYKQIHILSPNCKQLDHNLFGYIEDEIYIIPKKIGELFPPIHELTPSCNCKKCATKHCWCKAVGVSCCSFCACEITNTCKNPNTVQ